MNMLKKMGWMHLALLLPVLPMHATAQEVSPTAENLLFAPQSVRREAFSQVDALAPTRWVRAGDQHLPLNVSREPLGEVTYEVDGETFTLEDFMAHPSFMGIIVLDGDDIVLERYADGHNVESRWISFSVSKSVTSMLIGAAIHDGFIESVDEPISNYLPRFRGTEYGDVTIEQVLRMSSGVAWNEDYADPSSDVSQAGGMIGVQLLEYLGQLPRAHEVGEVFNYNTAETNLVGEILRAAIGNNASTYLEAQIWQPFGMGADATWLLGYPGGGETGGCCISATLRDYARIGLFAKGDGVLRDGTRVLPEGWMQASSTAGPASPIYGYQWWVFGPRTFAALGIFGQRIVVQPDSDRVMAVHSNAPTAVDSDYHRHLDALTEALFSGEHR